MRAPLLLLRLLHVSAGAGGEEKREEKRGTGGREGVVGAEPGATRTRSLARSPKNPREELCDAGSLSRAEAASSSADSLIKSNAATRGSDGAFKRRIVLPVRRVGTLFPLT